MRFSEHERKETMKTQNICGLSVTQTVDKLHANLVDSIQQAQYEILANDISRPDLRIKAILVLHELEKAAHNQYTKLQRHLEY
jgi:hypothetical protein